MVRLQCEVMNSPRYLEIRYAWNSGVGMRQAYDQMRSRYGLQALLILRRYLDAPSFDNLQWILETYCDSVVELSAYPMGVGVLGWNTLFWEVRNY